MIEYTAEKLWNFGKDVSVRDYIIIEAMNTGQDVKVIFKNDFMIIPNDTLLFSEFRQSCTKEFKSKYPEKDGTHKMYKLLDFEWRPEPLISEGKEVSSKS